MCIYPFYYVFIYSLSDPEKTALGVTLYPLGFTLDSYFRIFALHNIVNSFFVSAARTVVGTIVTVFCCSIFAYAVSKPALPGKKFIYRASIITMYFNAGLIPWYITMKFLGLQNNFLLYILPMAVSAFYLILMKTFFEQLPVSIEESAMLDGAGYFIIYRKICFPLSMPIIATIAVFASVAQWNSWSDNFFLVSSESLQTLQYILYRYLSAAQNVVSSSGHVDEQAVMNLSPRSIQTTITIVVTVPILFSYPFMQRYFVKGLLLGSVKA